MGSFVTMGMALAGREDVPSAPADRAFGAEGQQTLQGLRDVLPGQRTLQSELVPAYARDFAGALGSFLGGPGGFNALTREADVTSRAGDVTDISTLGPRLLSGLRAGSPGANLLDKLIADASGAIDSPLDPGLAREIAQAVRGAQASRGMGFGPADVYGEAIARSGAAADWRNRNRAYATGVAGLADTAYTKPMLDILTRRSPTPGMALGAAPGFGPRPDMDPWNPYASDVYNTNFNARYQDRFNTQARNADLYAQAAKSAGQGTNQLISTGLAFAGCWVAREVYGEANLKWLEFRSWLIMQAPHWFSKWYNRYGQRFAKWIHNKPLIKRLVRCWMDRRIKQYLASVEIK